MRGQRTATASAAGPVARSTPRWVLYFHTLRYLKLRQIVGRLRFRFARHKPESGPPPALRPVERTWQRCRRAPSMKAADRFVFLNVERTASAGSDWDRADWPKLWLYNLHYFDDLNADGAASRAEWHHALITRWLAENPPADGVGWEPYCVSLRIVNWVKWLLAGDRRGSAQTILLPVEQAMHGSLAVQSRWLCRRLEVHLLGNHLWANAKALLFAGAFFDGPEARRWRAKGRELLAAELDEQILSDGGHFERSPMYHATLLEDVLDLHQLCDVYPDAFDQGWKSRLARVSNAMLAWLAAMTHPDGGIALFNDAAFGVAPSLLELRAYAAVVGLPADDGPPLSPVVHLDASGYVRMTVGDAVLIADVGPIGPDYLPGHAHADTLSFELSLAGRRMVVDSGTSTYATGAERLRQRGTAAHNTVSVAGLDSSEVWDSFRVARRARPASVSLSQDDATIVLEATHDGFRRDGLGIIHRRRWRLSAQELTIEDTLESPSAGALVRSSAALHLAPEISVNPERCGASLLGSAWRVRIVVDGGVLVDEASTWHPRFGVEEPNRVLRISFDGARLRTTLRWSD